MLVCESDVACASDRVVQRFAFGGLLSERLDWQGMVDTVTEELAATARERFR